MIVLQYRFAIAGLFWRSATGGSGKLPHGLYGKRSLDTVAG